MRRFADIAAPVLFISALTLIIGVDSMLRFGVRASDARHG